MSPGRNTTRSGFFCCCSLFSFFSSFLVLGLFFCFVLFLVLFQTKTSRPEEHNVKWTGSKSFGSGFLVVIVSSATPIFTLWFLDLWILTMGETVAFSRCIDSDIQPSGNPSPTHTRFCYLAGTVTDLLNHNDSVYQTCWFRMMENIVKLVNSMSIGPLPHMFVLMWVPSLDVLLYKILWKWIKQFSRSIGG